MRKEDTTNNILVYVETADGAPVKAGLEALTPARKLAEKRGGQVIAAVIGKNISEAAGCVAASGADRVLAVDSDEAAVYDLDVYADILKQIIEKEKPDTVLLGGTGDGKDLAPKLAAQLDTAAVNDVTEIKTDGEKEVFVTTEYSGAVCCDVVVGEARPAIAVTRSGAFKKPENVGTGTVEAREVKAGDGVMKTKIRDTVKEITETVNLEDAEIIVSGGRGMGSKENFGLVEQLAEILGGEVGATRPAIEDGWIAKNHQVGQSGKTVSPKLYIAAGISGATQHLSGITGSDYIVAINKDEDAPIFSVANVGIVGDAMKVLPVMIEEIKKIREA
ncbi:electron transfer flavoprotein subunit alpha/FixB family protein [[Clostridium] aminophilum]|uniref:electron transfer flavoprotein subunit alpha/FixB family protein n=1 Tax=[Clostridium] aminophilum TaxID=1526 RepID=UPI003F999194